MAVKPRRTEYDDKTSLSDIHREWGWACFMRDLDFVGEEFFNGEAVVIVEYKNEHHMRIDLEDRSYKALINLADKASLPVFIAIYSDDKTEWEIWAINDIARDAVGTEKYKTDMLGWIYLLYAFRGVQVPNDVWNKFRSCK